MEKPIYDQIGIDYAVGRRTDPAIASTLSPLLANARRVLNIGAGTGSYEHPGIALTALEPSREMLLQRPADAHPAVQGYAESLPFAAHSFTHCMTILSMHHWSDRARAFSEVIRVTTERFVAVTWDPDAAPFWLTRDYFPEIHARDITTFPAVSEFASYFGEVEMKPLLIPALCEDGFLAAFWKRPAAYLEPQVRRSISSFATLGSVDERLMRLSDDLDSGRWHERNADILEQPAIDAGYRIVTANIR